MSMKLLTLLQIFGIFGAYSVMTLILPAILLYKKVSHLNFTIRFMIYQALGNFYMISLVLVLQLLHISNWYTLVIFTILPYFAAYAYVHERQPVQDLHDFLVVTRRLLEGQYGFRLYFRRVGVQLGAALQKSARTVRQRFLRNIPDIVLVCAVTAAVMGTYGVNAFQKYGYCMSDVVVHNYWINYMGKGQMYVSGVYPFGFHCVMYYLHIVFGIDTYVLLRLFWVVQTLLIHLMLLAFIRLCCKSKYTAYAGLGIYTLCGVFTFDTYSRYFSSLPQEFGMVFILPSIAFLFLFFEKKKQELQDLHDLDEENKENEEKKAGAVFSKAEPDRQAASALWKAPDISDAVKTAADTGSVDFYAEEERIYFLDDVLAESAARESACKESAGKKRIFQKQTPQYEDEAIITLEENPEDGSFSIKERPLNGASSASRYEGKPEISNKAIKRADKKRAEKEAKADKKRAEKKAKADKKERGKKNQQKQTAGRGKQGGMRQRFASFIKQESAKESTWYLAVFVLDFSMTLTIHFYNTIVAGLFCIGVAAGYFFRLFRKPYFGRIVLSGMLAAAVSILPMFLAFLGGTPLEGSLYWAMSVMRGEDGQPAPAAKEEEDEGIAPEEVPGFVVVSGASILLDGDIISNNGAIEGGTVLPGGDITIGDKIIKGAQMVSGAKVLADGEVYFEGIVISFGNDLPEPEPETDSNDRAAKTETVQKPGGFEEVKNKIQVMAVRFSRSVWNSVDSRVIDKDTSWLIMAVPLSIAALFILALLYFALRQTDYAARMMSVAAYMFCMTLMLCSAGLGLPALMDESRTSIYYSYSLIIVWCLCIDGALQLFLGWFKRKYLLDMASLLLLPVLAAAAVWGGMVKDVMQPEAMQSNDAVVCLTNIIRDNKDETWTIVSANDEVRMGEDHGYHYEVDTFLRKMEHQGGGSLITIPTKKVYFFIEKRPIDYAKDYEGSGQLISRIGAAKPLPFRSGISMYQGKSRWIEMSRLYYWAQTFKKMYPNEISTYYESNEFICYCVEQNEYSLYNFSINYAYNMIEYTEEK